MLILWHLGEAVLEDELIKSLSSNACFSLLFLNANTWLIHMIQNLKCIKKIYSGYPLPQPLRFPPHRQLILMLFVSCANFSKIVCTHTHMYLWVCVNMSTFVCMYIYLYCPVILLFPLNHVILGTFHVTTQRAFSSLVVAIPITFHGPQLVDIYVVSNPFAFIDKAAMNNHVHLSFPKCGSVFVQ